jgi:hypothetical protein
MVGMQTSDSKPVASGKILWRVSRCPSKRSISSWCCSFAFSACWVGGVYTTCIKFFTSLKNRSAIRFELTDWVIMKLAATRSRSDLLKKHKMVEVLCTLACLTAIYFCRRPSTKCN